MHGMYIAPYCMSTSRYFATELKEPTKLYEQPKRPDDYSEYSIVKYEIHGSCEAVAFILLTVSHAATARP